MVGSAGVGWVWTLLGKIVRLVSCVILGEHYTCPIVLPNKEVGATPNLGRASTSLMVVLGD